MFKEILRKMFKVFIFICLCSWSLTGVFGVDTDVMKSVSVTEGESVTLNTDITKVQKDDLILWMFGHKDIPIAQINRNDSKNTIFNDSAYGRFRDRLKLDQTGSLIITNTRTTDSGLYKVTSTRTKSQLNTFILTVYAHLPDPVIGSSLFTNSSQNSLPSSSISNCSLLCSAVNVSHVTLSWYKGNSLFSSISVSDLSISLSLPLEIECLDDSYSCVLNNPISNKTQHLTNTEFCHICSDQNPILFDIVPISAAAAAAVAAVVFLLLMCYICRKHRKTKQEVKTHEEEITYADPTFYKRKAPKSKVQAEEDVVYAGVTVRH